MSVCRCLLNGEQPIRRYANMGLGHAILVRNDMDPCLITKGWRQQEQ